MSDDYIKHIMLDKVYLKGLAINHAQTGDHLATVEKVTAESIFMRSTPLNYLMQVPRSNVDKKDPRRIKLYRDTSKNHVFGVLAC